MTKTSLLLSVCLVILGTSCQPSGERSSTPAAELNELAGQRFGIDMVALSYLINGQRVVSVDQASFPMFKQSLPIGALEAAGYVKVSTDAGQTGRVSIERTAEGDRIHRMFASAQTAGSAVGDSLSPPAP